MFRKGLIYLAVSVLLFSVIASPVRVQANEVDLAPNAKSVILIDQDTGTVIFEKSSHTQLPPASITKIMTMLLIMEALDSGQITLNDKVRVSEYAASMGGSQIFLEEGEEMTVNELLKGIALASGNDAAVAMSEYIAGSEEAFVNLMNKRAQELGLKDTFFQNSNGLPESKHYTSAYDIAIMSRELLKYEKITEYTGLYQDYLRKGSDNPFWLVNTNRLVRFYNGVDGLKTGYTNEAKFCLAATAKRGSLRVIVVVMGEPSSKIRNKEVSQLLDYAFNQYKNEVIYQKDQIITEIRVNKGKEPKVNAVAPQQISLLLKKNEKIEEYQQNINLEKEVKAPVKQGDKLGTLETVKEGQVISTIPLVAGSDVLKANLWDMIKITSKQFLFQQSVN